MVEATLRSSIHQSEACLEVRSERMVRGVVVRVGMVRVGMVRVVVVGVGLVKVVLGKMS